MDKEIIKKYSKLDIKDVSRETFEDFETYISMLLEKNNEINLISKSKEDNTNIRERHIVDSAQAIDFIDLNHNTTCDLGSGAGMPGIVLAIIMKNLKKKMKFVLYEKSYHKGKFLREVSQKLSLDTEIIQEDIFKTNNLEVGTITCRAFKPLPIILELVSNNFKTFNNIILYMGKSGKKILKETLTKWEIEYTEKKSITNNDSFLLNIKKFKRLN